MMRFSVGQLQYVVTFFAHNGLFVLPSKEEPCGATAVTQGLLLCSEVSNLPLNPHAAEVHVTAPSSWGSLANTAFLLMTNSVARKRATKIIK